MIKQPKPLVCSRKPTKTLRNKNLEKKKRKKQPRPLVSDCQYFNRHWFSIQSMSTQLPLRQDQIWLWSCKFQIDRVVFLEVYLLLIWTLSSRTYNELYAVSFAHHTSRMNRPRVRRPQVWDHSTTYLEYKCFCNHSLLWIAITPNHNPK
jgi:hypothetical protein